MLFNTLADLRVPIRLIGFLRATLVASRTGTHLLTTDFARIDDYLTLMQVRMALRLRSRLDLARELANLAVPPLLL